MTRRCGTWLALAAFVVMSGCTGGSDDVADEQFLEGRELVTVYRLDEPDGFDPVAFVENLGVVFEVDSTRLLTNDEDDDGTPQRVTLGSRTASESDLVAWGAQSGSWGLEPSVLRDDSLCRLCTGPTISEADALERAKTLFAAAGSPVDALDWEVGSANYVAGSNDVPSIEVRGYRLIDGQRYGSPFSMYFANGDQVLSVIGYTWEPIPAGEVGLLTAAEALRLDEITTRSESGVTADGATLVYDVEFRRETATAYLVPVWRYDLDADLGLTTSVVAIRPQDLPTD